MERLLNLLLKSVSVNTKISSKYLLGTIHPNGTNDTDYRLTSFNLSGSGCDDDFYVSRLNTVIKDREQLQRLLKIPQVEQRSPEWFDLRKNKITASMVGAIMNVSKFSKRSDQVLKKAFPDSKRNEFQTNNATSWGTMFEDAGMSCYSSMTGARIHNFGIIAHPTITILAASPDGITDSGVMVEMKCPFIRKSNGTVPEEYLMQVQVQLEVCDLTYCDYVECTIKHLSQSDYLQLNKESTDYHGIVIKEGNVHSPHGLTPYEACEWATENHIDSDIVFWVLENIQIKRIERDRAYFQKLLPELERFWKDVESARLEPEPAIRSPVKRVSKIRKEVCGFRDDDELLT